MKVNNSNIQEGKKVKEGTFHTWEFTEKGIIYFF
jgi:hypothetical protein